jgi:hypothetical protein
MTSTPTHPRAPRALIALVAITTALLLPGVAQGAEPTPAPKPGYMAFSSCREGSEFAGEGDWLAEQEGTYPISNGVASTCSEPGGALTLSDHGELDDTPGSGPALLLRPPGVIEGGVIHGSMISPEGQAFIDAPETSPTDYLAFCTELCTTWHNFEASVPAGTRELMAAAQCTESQTHSGFCSTSGTNAELKITSSTLLLRSEATPEAAGVGGSLTESPASGNADVTLTAHEENGTGIYRASVLVDGSQVYSATPDLNGGYCTPHGTYGGALLFHGARPCPAEVPVRAEVATSSFPEGAHQVEVDLEDAAGNRATIFSRMIAFQKPVAHSSAPAIAPLERGPCNGVPCSEAAKLTATAGEAKSTTQPQKHSAIRLTGRLTTPTGAPIKDAEVKLLQQITGSSTTIQVATASTSADGSWSLKAPSGPSRLLRVIFYSHTLDVVPAATLDFHESVPAIVSIHAPRHVRLGQFFFFSGQLSGGYIPPGGEEVQVQIKYGGKWRELELVDADSKGKWKYRYAFTLEPGTKWAFRAIAVRNGAYPFTSHESRIIHVAVRR